MYTRAPNEPRVEAPRAPTGEWLHPYHQVEETETVWDVGMFGWEAEGTTVEIERPDLPSPLVLPHPGATNADPFDL